MAVHPDNLPTSPFFGDAVADTVAMNFRVGGHVRCIMGELKGMEGVVTATRSDGRLLVCVAEGFFVELPRICLRNIEPGG